jgi:hypothetical protein
MNDSKFLSHEDRETLQRAVGILEGLMATTKDGVSDMLELVIMMIDEVLK